MIFMSYSFTYSFNIYIEYLAYTSSLPVTSNPAVNQRAERSTFVGVTFYWNWGEAKTTE